MNTQRGVVYRLKNISEGKRDNTIIPSLQFPVDKSRVEHIVLEEKPLTTSTYTLNIISYYHQRGVFLYLLFTLTIFERLLLSIFKKPKYD